MAFPTLSAQQETNRKILEDIQLKKQLLAKGVTSVAIGNLGTTTTIAGTPTTITQPPPGQMPITQLMGPPSDFSQVTGLLTSASTTRTVFNPSTGNTFGFFIPQDSHYGNTFIPVLPRLDPLPSNPVQK